MVTSVLEKSVVTKEFSPIDEIIESYEKEHGIAKTVLLLAHEYRQSLWEQTTGDNKINSWENCVIATNNAIEQYLVDKPPSDDLTIAKIVARFERTAALRTIVNLTDSDFDVHVPEYVSDAKYFMKVGIDNPQLFEEALLLLSNQSVFVNSDAFLANIHAIESKNLGDEISGRRRELLGNFLLENMMADLNRELSIPAIRQLLRDSDPREGYYLEKMTRRGKLIVQSSHELDDLHSGMDFYICLQYSQTNVMPILGIDLKSGSSEKGAYMYPLESTDNRGNKTIDKCRLCIAPNLVTDEAILSKGAVFPEEFIDTVKISVFKALDQSCKKFVKNRS